MRERVRAGLAGVRSVAARLVHAAPQVGQSMVEYAIIAALIAVVALGAVRALGAGVSTTFQHIDTSVNSVDNPGP